jgi:hypothetical protein
MAFFKSLVKQHGVQFFEPIGRALHAAGIRKPNPLNPVHAWALRKPLTQYAGWYAKEQLRWVPRADLPRMPERLQAHAEFAADFLQRARLEISGTMRKHQLKLADRQCRMSELSQQVQDATTILATALYASRHQDELVRTAGDMVCRDLVRRLACVRPSDRYFRAVTELGEAIAEGGATSLVGPKVDEIMMPYNDQ